MAPHSQRIDTDPEDVAWRELERQLAQPDAFDRLLQQEEEMESQIPNATAATPQQSIGSKAQIQWLQRALNSVSSFGIAENGVLSVQTRRALQKFQADQGQRPTGAMNPRTKAALANLSGMPAPRWAALDDSDAWEAELEGVSSRCPVDNAYVIRGFGQYSDDLSLLPPEQQNKMVAIANEILSSHSGTPGAAPVTEVTVIGHADPDVAREKKKNRKNTKK